MRDPELPARRIRCAFCRFWETVTPFSEAQWGYCERLEVISVINSEVGPPGLRLHEAQPGGIDQRPVTHESFGCTWIERRDAPNL